MLRTLDIRDMLIIDRLELEFQPGLNVLTGETGVELHGQNDDRGILNPKAHREMLDAYAKLDLEPVGALWRDMTSAARELKRAEKALAEIRAEEEFLRHAVSELDALDPQPGQEVELDVKRRSMQGAERIRDDVIKALEALGLNGAEGLMNDASRWMDGVAEQADGQLDEALASLGRAMTELGEAHHGVERCLQGLEFDPAELEQVEEQLFALRGLARKYDVLADDLAEFAEGLRIRLAALDGGEVELSDLRRALDEATAAYKTEAERLTAARLAAADKLDRAMGKELAPLKMERAVFKTDVIAAAPSAEGQDDVSFTVATNPGAPSGPLNKIASGGELSRFLLALKVCLTGTSTGITMIFDEIDRGVGGATADAVGRRLKSLAEGAQVLVVTHSPQVAALGGHHWRVEKQVRDEQTFSTVVPLDAGARVDEIARMVSGDTVTDAAKDAARVLLGG